MSTLWSCLLSLFCLVLSGLGDDSQAGGAAQCGKPEFYQKYNLSIEKDYYDVDEKVTVRCNEGYRPLETVITCRKPEAADQWDKTPQCIGQCVRPAGEGMVSAEKEFYDKDQYLDVRCMDGYRLSSSYAWIQCMNPRTDTEWSSTPHCIAQCKKPEYTNKYRISGEKSYYDVGEAVNVRCITGYRPIHERITCVTPQKKKVWDNPPQCEAQCKKPDPDRRHSLSVEKDYYDVKEKVTVKCNEGYRPLETVITCRRSGTAARWDRTPQCKAQCKRPENTKKYTLSPYKTSYNEGDNVTVQCTTGYRPVYNRIKCVSPDQWTSSPWCVERCKKPSISNLENVAPYKEYYNRDDTVTLQCKPGYYPSPDSIQCINDGDRDVWTPPAVCIEVKVKKTRVTSTSINLTIECTPDQCHTSSISSCIKHIDVYKECKSGKYVTFSNLKPFTQYEIITHRSFLILERLNIKTGDSAPTAPDIMQTPSMEDGTIVWKLSNNQGNITGSELNIVAWRDYNSSFTFNVTERFPPNVTRYKINLQHGTNYTFCLQGFTSVGGGEYKNTTIETPIGDPPIPRVIKEDFTLQLHPVSDVHGPISHYEIIIFTEGGSNTSDCVKFPHTPYNSTLTSYTAALLHAHNNLTNSITLGDKKQYGGYFNAPLIPNQEYTAYLRVTSKWKEDKSSCVSLGFFKAKDPVSAVHVIAGSVAALLLLLIVMVLAVLWRTGCYRKLRKTEEIPLKSGLGKKKDIPVDNLLDAVKTLRYKEMCDDEIEDEENANILAVGRYLEYKELPSGLLHPCKIGQAEENQLKNRYKKVIPYDVSRVILRSSPSGSDYINASYIDGYRAPKYYIAAQGPLPETVADFWSMVWQESSSVIVVLTALEEQNKVKCACYWPEQAETYGDITVSLQKVDQTGAIITRSFSLKKMQSTVQVMVEQLQYLEWPDHGVPSKPSGLLQLVEQMNKCNAPGSGPVIVHCSAGIGRTGTFMALDILLKMARAVKKVNVFNCILQLRKNRINMVQNKDQYTFLYDILLETLLCGMTSVPVPDIERHLRHMTRRDPHTQMNGYDREFQALEKITELYQIYQCKEAKKPENQMKNRNSKILPGDHCRPILMSALARHGAPGYINAVFVNSNCPKDVIIATQLPMKETLEDFWSLVWDYKCTSVVVMHRAQDLPQISSRFWPHKGQSHYGDFSVMATTKNSGIGYRSTSLILRRENEPSDYSLDVKLWQLDSWPMDRDLPQNPFALVTVIGEVEKSQQQMADSHVLVTCGDGASRSGLFCAGLMLCDQIRSDGIVDVSQALRSLRKRRCQFIPSKEQYSFCYVMAQSYLDSFETYGNFK